MRRIDHQAFVYAHTAQERIVVGMPAADAVVDEVARLGATRVVVVSSRSLARHADGPLQRVERALDVKRAATFATMHAHTPREDVVAVAAIAREMRADLLVAVGGGSVIDGCKAAAMCVWLDLADVDALDAYRTGREGVRPIEAPPDPLRVVSISTTLSAADFTSLAGVTDGATHAKQSFSHRLFVPRVAILDPAATLDTPMDLLLSSGIRAVDHAVESYCAPNANAASAMHSLQGLRLLHDALPAIRREPASLAARSAAQLGMWQAIAATVAGAGTGASHGIGYALGATFGIAHGHTSCVMLPAVLRWNASVDADRQVTLSSTMGDAATPAGDLIADLVAGLGLPRTLRDLGIGRDQFGEIARRALTYAPVRANPRPVRSTADVEEILALAW